MIENYLIEVAGPLVNNKFDEVQPTSPDTDLKEFFGFSELVDNLYIIFIVCLPE